MHRRTFQSLTTGISGSLLRFMPMLSQEPSLWFFILPILQLPNANGGNGDMRNHCTQMGTTWFCHMELACLGNLCSLAIINLCNPCALGCGLTHLFGLDLLEQEVRRETSASHWVLLRLLHLSSPSTWSWLRGGLRGWAKCPAAKV